MERTIYRTCTLCEACCGIEIRLEGDRVRELRGDPLDPLSRGHVCAKLHGLRDLHEDPDRLRRPLWRSPSGWKTIDWPEAYAHATRGLLEVQRQHGPESAALYTGEPVVHNLGALLFMDELQKSLGTHKRFSANSLDQMPKQLVSHWMYGSGFSLSVPDLDRTDHWLMIGANPAVSNGSLLTAPGMKRRLRELRDRGGRVVLIDPRRNETAKSVDRHHFIRPGTDALLLAALVRWVIHEKRVRTGSLPIDPAQINEVAAFVQPFAPEQVAARTGMAASTIRRLAAEFCDAERAVCYGRMGTTTTSFGTTTSWLIEVLNALTGNLDRPGGAMFPRPAVDVAALQPATQRARWHSRTRGVPEFMGELPAVTLAEEITTPGPGQVRALVTLAGNPVLSSPGGARLSCALTQLDFMVAIDFYRNETTRHANLILPPVGPLERDHFDVVFQLFALRNTPHWSPRAIEPAPDQRTDGQILLEMSRSLCRHRSGCRMQSGLYGLLLAIGAERSTRILLDLALRAGPNGSRLRPWRRGLTLRKLRRARHGLDLGPMQAELARRLSNGRIDLAPKPILDEQARLQATLADTPAALVLIGRRETRSLNSWSHNWESLVKGPPRCMLEIHPADAAKRTIRDGTRVTLSSRCGSIQVVARISDAVMPGVVSLPHGYGHTGDGIELRLAVQHAGASLNDLTDPDEIDRLSGNAVLNGTPVEIVPTPAPVSDPTSGA